MSKPIAQHSDGSNCYTPNCSLGHMSSSTVAARMGDVSGFLKAKETETAKNVHSPTTYKMLEYGSSNYNLFMQKSEDLTNQVSAQEFKAISEYTGWAYQQYYGFLEGTNEDGSPFGSQYDELTQTQLKGGLQAGVASLDSVISKAGKLDNPVTVFRGERPPKNISLEAHLATSFPVGQKINVKRYLSTSLDPKIASETVGSDENSSYVLVIQTKEGAMLGEHISEQGLREKEVLLPRDRTYKVERISTDFVQWGSTKRKHATVYLTAE